MPAFAIVTRPCSITSWMAVRSMSDILSNSSMQTTPRSARTMAPASRRRSPGERRDKCTCHGPGDRTEKDLSGFPWRLSSQCMRDRKQTLLQSSAGSHATLCQLLPAVLLSPQLPTDLLSSPHSADSKPQFVPCSSNLPQFPFPFLPLLRLFKSSFRTHKPSILYPLPKTIQPSSTPY